MDTPTKLMLQVAQKQAVLYGMCRSSTQQGNEQDGVQMHVCTIHLQPRWTPCLLTTAGSEQQFNRDKLS
jgi:hypothetical protein